MKDSARWLLEFAKKELPELTGKQSALAAELAAVGIKEAGDLFGRFKFAKMELVSLPEKQAGDLFPVTETQLDPFAYFLTCDAMSQASMMGAFQGWLKDQFKQAEAGRGWKLDPSLMPFRTIDLFNTRASDNSLPGDTHIGSVVEYFEIAANRIVERERDRFGICQRFDCRNPFVAARKRRGKYCSPRCAFLRQRDEESRQGQREVFKVEVKYGIDRRNSISQVRDHRSNPDSNTPRG